MLGAIEWMLGAINLSPLVVEALLLRALPPSHRGCCVDTCTPFSSRGRSPVVVAAVVGAHPRGKTHGGEPERMALRGDVQIEHLPHTRPVNKGSRSWW
eukprot:1696301-Pyramimonas_sp.AAC.1